MTVIVVESHRDRVLAIVDELKNAGDCEVIVIGNDSGLARKIAAHEPDVVLIEVDNPSRDKIEELTLASGPLERPVAMFVPHAGSSLSRAAIEAGVSAYVVDGMAPERLRPILEIAFARFQVMRQMRAELEQTRRALDERKIIDRAKGLLIKSRGIGEDEGLYVTLEAQANWKVLLDGVISGELDGAQMLAGQPLAAAIGYGTNADIVTPFSMDLNGNAITVSNSAWQVMKPNLPLDDRGRPRHPISASALKPVVNDYRGRGEEFRMGMVFPVSTHNFELRYWQAAGGLPLSRAMRHLRLGALSFDVRDRYLRNARKLVMP